MLRRAALALIVALIALPAHAELVEVDLFAPGDKLVTRDTEAGLDWLDLGGVTAGFSYDDIQSGAGGWLASGWRYATEAEVCALFVAHTEATTCNFDSGIFFGPIPIGLNLINLLERTDTSFVPLLTIGLSGLYDDANGGAVGRARLAVSTTFPPGPTGPYLVETQAVPDAVSSSTASGIVGSFLVRATPPQVPALPWVGIAALAVLLALSPRRAATLR